MSLRRCAFHDSCTARPDFQMPPPCSASPTPNTIAPKSGVRESSVACVCRQRWRLQVQQWLLSDGDSALARAAAAQHTSAAANPPPPVRLSASMLLSSDMSSAVFPTALLRCCGGLVGSLHRPQGAPSEKRKALQPSRRLLRDGWENQKPEARPALVAKLKP